MGTRVLFIGGWGRSGSTLLDRLLGHAEGTVSVGEMRDVWQRGVIENRLCGCGEPFLDCPVWSKVGHVAFGGWQGLDVTRLVELRNTVDRPWFVPFLLLPALMPHGLRADVQEYADAVARLYAAIDEVSGGRVVIDSSKIPSYSLILRLAGVEQVVVHLVRDSRGVVHSWRKEVQRTDATSGADLMHRYGVVPASLRYLFYNGLTQALGLRGLPYLRLRYEDLVREPLQALEDVADFAGLELGAALRTDLEQHRTTLRPSHTVDGNPMRMQVGSTRIAVDDAWRSKLPGGVRRTVSLLTWPLLRRYGYLGSTRDTRQRTTA